MPGCRGAGHSVQRDQQRHDHHGGRQRQPQLRGQVSQGQPSLSPGDNIAFSRGYPEPTITWQREDKQPIVIRDQGGQGSMKGDQRKFREMCSCSGSVQSCPWKTLCNATLLVSLELIAIIV